MALGEERELSDEDRLERMNERSRRDFMCDRDGMDGQKMDGEDAVRFIDFWRSDVEVASTPREQGQILRFLEDLRGHLLKPPDA